MMNEGGGGGGGGAGGGLNVNGTDDRGGRTSTGAATYGNTTNSREGGRERERERDQSAMPSRYESQKRRDWNTFGQYLRNHRPPLALNRCSGAHVLEFLRYLDQFGKTKVHNPHCPFFGHPHPPAPCPCPLKQAWGSLDALIGRLRAAYEENGGQPESNPFGARAVRLYLREVREMQAKARGIAYEKKKRKRPTNAQLQLQQQQQMQLQQQQQPEQVPMLQNETHLHHFNQVHLSPPNPVNGEAGPSNPMLALPVHN